MDDGKGEGGKAQQRGYTRTMVSSDDTEGRFRLFRSSCISLPLMIARLEGLLQRYPLVRGIPEGLGVWTPPPARRIVVVVSVTSSHVFVGVSGDFFLSRAVDTTVGRISGQI